MIFNGDRVGSRRFWALLLIIVSFAFAQSTYAVTREDAGYLAGKAIFKGQCTSCHKVHDKLIGPPLAGVYDKYEREWLYKWIKNSQALIKSGDPDANAIYNEYNKSVMTAFALSNEEIDNVLLYLEAETTLPPELAEGEVAGGAEEAGASSMMTTFLAIIMALLLVIVFVLSRVTSTLGDLVREKMGKLVPIRGGMGEFLGSRKFLAALSLALVMLVGYTMVDQAQTLGRQQNYAPTQPIKFSHELHAGTLNVECQYCHVGAAKGKSAVIPSANICMNCHKAVKNGPKYGESEIAKIYDAVGWDADKMVYKENYEQKPIEWIRIHNLPDHVYFNHAQHVNAGGQECQTCHGAVEEMEVMRQHSSLGMGWCINCHRQTEIKFTSNDYYQVYEEYHEKLKSGEINKVTVEDIGGLECQKCHY